MPAATYDLCTVADVKLSDRQTSGDDDALAQQMITAASYEILRLTGREFAPATADVTRRFRLRPARRLDGLAIAISFSPYDLRTASSVKLHPETSSPVTLAVYSDFMLHTQDARDGTYTELLVYPASVTGSTVLARFGYALVDVRGDWGFAAIPVDVSQACIDTVKSWLERDYGQSSWAGAMQEGRTLGAGLPPGYSIPRRALDRLRRYARAGVA